MDIDSFLKRAEAVKARHRLLETVPGSGYHDSDKDAHGKLCAPHMRHQPGGCAEGKQPLPRISDHVIAFHDKRVARLFGPDAIKARDALFGYFYDLKSLPPHLLLTLMGTDRKLLVEIPGSVDFAAAPDGRSDDVLTLPLDTWNDFLHVFDAHGVGVSCLPYAE